MIYNTLAHYYDALVKDEEASREWVSWIESELAPCDCLELACGSVLWLYGMVLSGLLSRKISF